MQLWVQASNVCECNWWAQLLGKLEREERVGVGVVVPGLVGVGWWRLSWRRCRILHSVWWQFQRSPSRLSGRAHCFCDSFCDLVFFLVFLRAKLNRTLVAMLNLCTSAGVYSWAALVWRSSPVLSLHCCSLTAPVAEPGQSRGLPLAAPKISVFVSQIDAAHDQSLVELTPGAGRALHSLRWNKTIIVIVRRAETSLANS